jgi:hypothetical protein
MRRLCQHYSSLRHQTTINRTQGACLSRGGKRGINVADVDQSVGDFRPGGRFAEGPLARGIALFHDPDGNTLQLTQIH